MRIAGDEVQAFTNNIRANLPEDKRFAKLYLFGSRTKKHLRGGDIDLLIHTDPRTRAELAQKKSRILSQIHKRIGERKIDLVLSSDMNQPFEQQASKDAILLRDFSFEPVFFSSTGLDLKRIWKKIKPNGKIVNHSSKQLWVVDSDKDRGKSVAHLLHPHRKSPPDHDIDAFKRQDGIVIEGHPYWWKFYAPFTADIYDAGSDLKVSLSLKRKVPNDHFGKDIQYLDAPDWGLPVHLVKAVQRKKNKAIDLYLVEPVGWLTPQEALAMSAHGLIDNATPVFPASGKSYLRTRPDVDVVNNISDWG